MIFRNLDENHDWQFGKGLQDYARHDKAIALNIKTRLLSWVNDCFFDLGAGVDWLNRLGDKSQRRLLEDDLRRIIIQTPDVTGVNSFDTTLANRRFAASYSITTKYGATLSETITERF